jgi:hypothetical protein
LWEARRPAEVQARSADRHLRQSNRFRDTVIDAEVERIQLRIRREGDVDAIETKPRFVDDRGSESVCFIEREDLPARNAAMFANVKLPVSLPVLLL